jgi:alanyl-tRNA synthetase
LIKIIGTEKIRKHIRVQSKIGAPAYQFYSLLNTAVRRACTLLSMELEDLVPRIQTLLDEQRDLKHQIKSTTEKWLYELAGDLKPAARFGLFQMTDLSSEQLNKISAFWLGKNDLPCLMISRREDRIYFVLRTPPALKATALVFIQTYGRDLYLKGGGTDDFVQGIVTHPRCDQEYLTAVESSLTHYFQE